MPDVDADVDADVDVDVDVDVDDVEAVDAAAPVVDAALAVVEACPAPMIEFNNPTALYKGVLEELLPNVATTLDSSPN